MSELILKLHILSSIIPSILTLIIIFRSIKGIMLKNEIRSIDQKLPLFVLGFLYLQLALGILLYFIHIDDYSQIENADQAVTAINTRFWALEHFLMMFFALVLSHIGFIYSKNLKSNLRFHKKNLLFYGLICILIMTSLTLNALRHSGF